ncbi:bifunctional riboflavin kinase/FAD synthetase [Sanguibacter sp. A247]|uniref:bifunctional riboflavin kinase/FAD synthetase n=1 Tax=unclassified Sanguibacter TaxID=2645534 RepID=UPI003FD7C242
MTPRAPRRPDARAWPPAADGVVIVDKPAGMTSHDVVAKMRWLARTRKVGHAGTLDPMATGVLVLGVGRATRVLTYLVGADKEYVTTIRLGQSTSTDDAQGDITATTDAAHVTGEALRAAAAGLTGDIEQVPSTVSAIKVDGRRAYDLARAGEEVELKARPVTVARFDVGEPRVVVVDGARVVDVEATVECSSGTYVRALARDLGAALGVGAHLTALRRTRVGGVRVEDAHALDALVARAEVDHLPVPTVESALALEGTMPQHVLDPAEALAVVHGRRAERGLTTAAKVAGVDPDGRLVAVLERTGAWLKPVTVFMTPDEVGPVPEEAATPATPANVAAGSDVPVWRSYAEVPADLGPTVVTIGNFDGVHLGHQEVLGVVVDRARATGAAAVAVTFTPHPRAVHAPQEPLRLVTSTQQRYELLVAAGLDGVLELDYSLELAAQTPREFVETCFVRGLRASVVVVGQDVRLGAGNSGNLETLVALGAEHGFEVVTVTDRGVAGGRWSSTAARRLLDEGDVARAAKILGRPHRLRAEVVHGDARGRTIGFPTANLSQEVEGLVPADGVYAGWLLRSGSGRDARLPAAVSIGTNPTFDGTQRRVEAYVLDRTDLDLYGEVVALDLVAHLRPTLRFDSVDTLVTQMNRDVARVRELLAAPGGDPQAG